MPNLVTTVTTPALRANVIGEKKSYLIAVHFDRFDDDTVRVYAVSGHNGEEMKAIRQRKITRARLQALPDDALDPLVFAEAAFDLLDIEITGREA
jgi:hypothetical protein